MPAPGPTGAASVAGAGRPGSLRVLAVTKLYPPHHLGAAELVHQGVDDRLRAAADVDLRVLTTDHVEPQDPDRADRDAPDVHRELHWYWRDHAFPRIGPARTLAIERHNHRTLRRHLDEHRPDVVVWWGMGGMSLSLIGAVRAAGVPEVFVVQDRWPVYGPVFDRFAKGTRPLGPARGALARALGSDRPGGPAGTVLVTSTALAAELARRRAIPSSYAVLEPGIALPAEPPPVRPWEGRLLWLGRLDGPRGAATAVDALAAVAASGAPVRLTVAGDGDVEATRTLRARADAKGVGMRTAIRGRPDEAELRALLGVHDALLLPLRPGDQTPTAALSALAHGVAVVAVGEAATEHLDATDHLAVAGDDDGALAGALVRLGSDAVLRDRLRVAGRSVAEGLDEERFRDRVVEAIRGAARDRGA